MVTSLIRPRAELLAVPRLGVVHPCIEYGEPLVLRHVRLWRWRRLGLPDRPGRGERVMAGAGPYDPALVEFALDRRLRGIPRSARGQPGGDLRNPMRASVHANDPGSKNNPTSP